MDNYMPITVAAEENRKAREKYLKAASAEKTKNLRGADRHRILSKGKRRFICVGSGMDMPFFLLILVLLVIGIIMMFSASYANAYYSMGDSYYYLSRQLVWAVVGVLIMIGISYLDYHVWHKLSLFAIVLAFILLVLVLFTPAINKVHRWINLGFTNLQPSEVLKFALVLFFAHWASVHYNKMTSFKFGVLPAIILLGTSSILLVLEPHYSCIVIIVLLMALMMFVAGVKKIWFLIAAGAVLGIFLIMYITGTLTYAMERLDGWGQALNYTTSDMWQTTWQTRNSLYAIGSGGLWGLGLGQSRQKYLYLPEPQNDFVFSVVCEELGLIGAGIILIIFGLLVWRGITIAIKAKDKFGTILGVGLSGQLGLQVVLNILVITDWLPNTGISLPFFSYGGSSLVMILLQMGIMLAISRQSKLNKA